jgi:hypothetical protein
MLGYNTLKIPTAMHSTDQHKYWDETDQSFIWHIIMHLSWVVLPRLEMECVIDEAVLMGNDGQKAVFDISFRSDHAWGHGQRHCCSICRVLDVMNERETQKQKWHHSGGLKPHSSVGGESVFRLASMGVRYLRCLSFGCNELVTIRAYHHRRRWVNGNVIDSQSTILKFVWKLSISNYWQCLPSGWRDLPCQMNRNAQIY